jgi:hypothetical protein
MCKHSTVILVLTFVKTFVLVFNGTTSMFVAESCVVIKLVGVRGGRGTRVCEGKSGALSASAGPYTHCTVQWRLSTFTKNVAFTVPSCTKLEITQVKFRAWTFAVPGVIQIGGGGC